ncbi:hypothetical protein AB0H12_45105 [Actinosynnema sp. NPDC023794]
MPADLLQPVEPDRGRVQRPAKCAADGTDHLGHIEHSTAIAAYIRRRDARSDPATGLITDSPIRSWTDQLAEGCVTRHWSAR